MDTKVGVRVKVVIATRKVAVGAGRRLHVPLSGLGHMLGVFSNPIPWLVRVNTFFLLGGSHNDPVTTSVAPSNLLWESEKAINIESLLYLLSSRVLS